MCRKVRSTPDNTVAKVFCVTEYAANGPTPAIARQAFGGLAARAFRRKSFARADAGTIRAVIRNFLKANIERTSRVRFGAGHRICA